jgi:predicted 3-demethylubiquinone-9 3-methyltransferase (glyoxalase superfamily)
MAVEFNPEGRKFIALNGGPAYKFKEAMSFIVNCETKEELDYWQKLSRGGDPQARVCG